MKKSQIKILKELGFHSLKATIIDAATGKEVKGEVNVFVNDTKQMQVEDKGNGLVTLSSGFGENFKIVNGTFKDVLPWIIK